MVSIPQAKGTLDPHHLCGKYTLIEQTCVTTLIWRIFLISLVVLFQPKSFDHVMVEDLLEPPQENELSVPVHRKLRHPDPEKAEVSFLLAT